MASFGDAMKKIVAAVAPGLGAALGGPLGGTAGAMVAKALGKDGAPDEEIVQTLQTADPDTLLKLKQAEIEWQQFLKNADLKQQDLENQDRASARSREVSLHDKAPTALAAVVTVGFFLILGFMLKWGLPKEGEQALLVMLGALGGAWGSIIAYFFGSSSSSRTKDATISAAALRK